MNFTPSTLSITRLSRFLFAGVIATLLCSAVADAQFFVFSGLPIESKKFDILVNPFGYSDSMLDQHWGFKGREYLSGEWAAAVYYQGGHLPAMVRWLTPEFVFPDRINPVPHFAVLPDIFGNDFRFAANPTNEFGFPVFVSIITNADLQLEITYQMCDLGTNETDRLPMGLVPASAGGAGSNLWSARYVFKQSYKVTNRSGQTLSFVRFYQFIHALQSTAAVYDDRNYGGQLSDYHYTVTQWGDTHALHSRRGTTYNIRDYLSVSANWMPNNLEVGLFSSTNHQSDWPDSDTVAAVENNSPLSGKDQIYTNHSAFVCGVMCFELGTLPPDGVTNIDFILSVHSVRTLMTNLPPVNVVVHKVYIENGSLNSVVEETTGNPFANYAMQKTIDLNVRKRDWERIPILVRKNYPQNGWDTITAPPVVGVDQCYIAVGMEINETPFTPF